MEPVGLGPEGGPAKKRNDERSHRARRRRQDTAAVAGRERRRRGSEGREAEADAEEGRRSGEVREVHDVGRRLLPPLQRVLVQVVARLVRRPVQVIVERHEQRVVAAEMCVVQRVEPANIYI